MDGFSSSFDCHFNMERTTMNKDDPVAAAAATATARRRDGKSAGSDNGNNSSRNNITNSNDNTNSSGNNDKFGIGLAIFHGLRICWRFLCFWVLTLGCVLALLLEGCKSSIFAPHSFDVGSCVQRGFGLMKRSSTGSRVWEELSYPSKKARGLIYISFSICVYLVPLSVPHLGNPSPVCLYMSYSLNSLRGFFGEYDRGY